MYGFEPNEKPGRLRAAGRRVRRAAGRHVVVDLAILAVVAHGERELEVVEDVERQLAEHRVDRARERSRRTAGRSGSDRSSARRRSLRSPGPRVRCPATRRRRGRCRRSRRPPPSAAAGRPATSAGPRRSCRPGCAPGTGSRRRSSGCTAAGNRSAAALGVNQSWTGRRRTAAVAADRAIARIVRGLAGAVGRAHTG